MNELRKLEKPVTRTAPAGAVSLFMEELCMNDGLRKKPFLDYEHQILLLEKKGLIIQDKERAIEILTKTSYYGLINGYKAMFKDPNTNKYKEGTSFEDIYALYLFDEQLREIILKYILIFEKAIKSSLSYHFSALYGNGISEIQDISNYEYGKHKSDIQYLFRKMKGKISGRHVSPQIEHYMNVYKDVPLWVLITDLTLGETATMYRFLKGRCKTLVCNDFHGIGRAELGKMLIILTKYRNICAHGNRLFNSKTGDSILDCEVHKKLRINKSVNGYCQGKSDLFSVVISLKYLLDKKDFREFYCNLKGVIQRNKLNDQTLNLMGFPPEWTSISRITVY